MFHLGAIEATKGDQGRVTYQLSTG